MQLRKHNPSTNIQLSAEMKGKTIPTLNYGYK